MLRDPLKMAAVLGDPTRYRIFEHIVRRAPGGVTAQEMARRFSLHPNVARMHLAKLQRAGLLFSRPDHRGRSGRPVHLYFPTGRAATFAVPTRNFELLAELLSLALGEFGPTGLEALDRVGAAFGRRVAENALAGTPSPGSDPLRRLGAAADRLREQGIEIQVTEEPDGARITVTNCVFHELALSHPEHVCRLCTAMMQGLVSVCSTTAGIQVTGIRVLHSLPRGDERCEFATTPR